jgi:putative oxidoreductase
MEKLFGRFSDPAYAIFRIVIGGLFLQHGLQKIFGLLGGSQPPVGSQLWIGGLIELVCGAAVLVGFQTRWAAFLACGQMAVAYFQFHQPKGALPIQNGGESAVLYCFAFLLLATHGNGKWSVSGHR